MRESWRKRVKPGRNARNLAEMPERWPKRVNARRDTRTLVETRESWPKRVKAGRNARELAETRESWPKHAKAGEIADENARKLTKTRECRRKQVCLYMHDPREPHFAALKRILWYVRGTLDHGLQRMFLLPLSSLHTPMLIGQVTLSRYNTEAEYRGVANVIAETSWIRNLLQELHTPLHTATIVYCDNVSVVYLFSNPVQHQRTKHIEIDIHFVHDYVASGQVRVLHVPSRFQYADIFTKGLPSALFLEFCSSLNGRDEKKRLDHLKQDLSCMIEDKDEPLNHEASDKEVDSDLESTASSKPKCKKLKKTAKAIFDRTFRDCP
ncbi:ribonuclease H-like domain-containing protein [Tanacetum coccineum]